MTSEGPLAGIRILDLTTVQMGPWCTRICADLGADVIKVEAPEGDSSRYTGGGARNRGMGGSFQHNTRGKRSIALDLKRPEAREAILRLARGADALASNIRPAALERSASATRRCGRRTRASSTSPWSATAAAGAMPGGRPMTT